MIIPRSFRFWTALGLSLTLVACSKPDDAKSLVELNAAQIKPLIPSNKSEAMSWATDIQRIMSELGITRDIQNVCSIIAIIDQESNFVADPEVAGLGQKSIEEIQSRLENKLGKVLTAKVIDILEAKPTPDNSYFDQIRQVKTEQQLDLLYREMFNYYSTQYHVKLLADATKWLTQRDFAEQFNPITTLGSMQVHIQYARRHSQVENIDTLRNSLYTQYGGLYYGIHRLMMYPAQYDAPLYRFADYNSGMYSSRNAAFQQMLSTLTNSKLDLDGDLLLYGKDGSIRGNYSQAERALNQLLNPENNKVLEKKIRSDLTHEKTKEFEKTSIYTDVIKRFEQQTGQKAPYAIMPQVIISGPKLSKDHNTNWFAERVNTRFERCLNTAKEQGYSN